MEIPEPVELVNQRLIDHFGKFENGEANFRIVWSDDQYEKRLIYHTPEGLELLTPVMKEMPKYKHYILHKYILERLVPVPDMQMHEMAGKLSYEPLWVFQDNNNNALPPLWEVAKLVIETVFEAMSTKKGPYKQAEEDGNTTEAMEYRAKKLEEALYGNETAIGDALARGEAVGYGTYRRNDTRFNNNPIKIH